MKNSKMLMIPAALLAVPGLILTLSGNLWGIAMVLVAAALVLVAMMQARAAAGYGNDDVFFNGPGGQGRQQSEVEKRK